MRSVTFHSLFIAFFAYSFCANAEDCDPKKILIQDTNISVNQDTTKVAILDQIDRDHFEDARKSSQVGGTLVEGTPLSGCAKFDDFRTALDREKKLYKYDLNERKVAIVVQQSLSENALNAYISCLQKNRDTGVFVWATNTGAFSDKAIINIKWLGGVGGAQGQLENGIPIEGATLSDATKTIPNSWRDKQVVSLILNRHRNKDAIIIVKISGYSETIIIPKDPPLVTTEENWITTKPVQLETDKDDKFKEVCLSANSGEFFILNEASPSYNREIVGDANHNKIIRCDNPQATPPADCGAKNNAKRVCMTVSTSTGKTGVTQSIKATMSVLRQKITIKD